MQNIGCFENKMHKQKFMMFTGHEFEDIPAWCFDMFNVIKHGKYDETKKTNWFRPAQIKEYGGKPVVELIKLKSGC